jgi:hypothetical protein
MQKSIGELSPNNPSYGTSLKVPTPNEFRPRHRQQNQEVAIDADVSGELVEFGEIGGKETELLPVLPSLTQQTSAAPKQKQKFRPVKPKSQVDKVEKPGKVEDQQDKKKEAKENKLARDQGSHFQEKKSNQCNPDNSPALSGDRVGNSEPKMANRKRKTGNQRRRDKERKRQAYETNDYQSYSAPNGTEAWNHYEHSWDEYYREKSYGHSTQHQFQWDRQIAGSTMHERDWHIRLQELDAFARAQAERQQELDALAVSLEIREWEPKNHKDQLVAENDELTKSIMSKKNELEKLCEEHRNKSVFFEKEHESERESYRKELEELRCRQSKEKEAHKRALDEVQRVHESRLNVINNKINALVERETRISLEIQKQEEEISKARRTLENEFEQRRIELDSLAAALSSRGKYLDEKEIAQALREDRWVSMKTQIETSFATSETRLAARESKLCEQQVDLDRLKADFEASEMERAVQYQNWASEKDKLQKSLRDLELMLTKKKNDLEIQSIQQAKQQKELRSRDAALKRRARELKAQKRDIDSAQAKQSAQRSDNKDEHKSYSTAKEFPCTKEKSADIGSSVKPAPQRKRGESADSKDAGKTKQAGIDYILIDSDSDDEVQPKKPKPATTSCNRTWDYGKYYNAQFTVESAQELQERLFREAAEKLRARATSSTSAESSNHDNSPSITTPISNINELYPEHWRWKDPYSVLGLPAHSSMKLVKTHYRKLARIYHPDSSGSSSTSNKFHAITLAYRKLHG